MENTGSLEYPQAVPRLPFLSSIKQKENTITTPVTTRTHLHAWANAVLNTRAHLSLRIACGSSWLKQPTLLVWEVSSGIEKIKVPSPRCGVDGNSRLPDVQGYCSYYVLCRCYSTTLSAIEYLASPSHVIGKSRTRTDWRQLEQIVINLWVIRFSESVLQGCP